ncbi:hypothetical protein GCM10022230_13310 [Pseudoclavibacter caeni]
MSASVTMESLSFPMARKPAAAQDHVMLAYPGEGAVNAACPAPENRSERTCGMHGQRQSSVAIIIRTKNRPYFLARALDDAQRQSYADWSAIVVNDGGEPAPVDEIVDDLPPDTRTRVQVLHRQESTGMESASNAGIRASSSTFLAIHDDDDTWHPDFLNQTVRYLESSDSRAVMTRTEIVHEHVDGNQIIEDSRELYAPEITEIDASRMAISNQGVPISCLYRRDLHDEVGLYDESLPVVGDWDFYLRVLTVTTIGFIDGEPLAFYHQRPKGSAGTAGNTVNEWADLHQQIDRLVRERHFLADVQARGWGDRLVRAKLFEQQAQSLHEHLHSATMAVLARQNEIEKNLDIRLDQLNQNVQKLAQQLSALQQVTEANTPGRFLRRTLHQLFPFSRAR